MEMEIEIEMEMEMEMDMEIGNFQEKNRIYVCTSKYNILPLLGLVIRGSMQPSHSQWSTVMPQNPCGEQQG